MQVMRGNNLSFASSNKNRFCGGDEGSIISPSLSYPTSINSQYNSNSAPEGNNLRRQLGPPSQNAHIGHSMMMLDGVQMVPISSMIGGGGNIRHRKSAEKNNKTSFFNDRGSSSGNPIRTQHHPMRNGHASMSAIQGTGARRIVLTQSFQRRNGVGGDGISSRGADRNESWGNLQQIPQKQQVNSGLMRNSHTSMHTMMQVSPRVLSNQNIQNSKSGTSMGSGRNESWGRMQKAGSNGTMRVDHGSMSSMQGSQRQPPNQDLHKKHGVGGSKGAGKNFSWGNMQQISKPQQQQRENNSMINNNREGRNKKSFGNMLQRPNIQMHPQQGYNTSKVAPNQSSLRNSLLTNTNNTSAFSFGNHGSRMMAMVEKSTNENWDNAFDKGGGFNRPQDSPSRNSDNMLSKDQISGENPLLVDLADKGFRNGWDMYMGDNHKPLDKDKGEELILKAMSEGSVIAKGFCLANGWGNQKDLKMAFSIFKAFAVHKGDYYGMSLKAYCLLDGNGVKRNTDEAIYWLARAIQLKKSGWAMGLMGSCYQDGDGVEQDEEKAVQLYKDAAEQGYVKAMYKLGRMYEKGSDNKDTIPSDKEEGVKWYRKASLQNHSKAKEKVERLSNDMFF